MSVHIKIPEMSRHNKRTWPIRGRGLGVVSLSKEVWAIQGLLDGSSTLTKCGEDWFCLKNSRGESRYKSGKAMEEALLNEGLDIKDYLHE